MKKQHVSSLALGSAFILSAALSGGAFAEANPFSATELQSAYELAGAEEGKCGEGKCGEGEAKGEEGKCGEGKCGGEEKDAEGKCGEGKCGA